jgi:hypothetical protein
MPVREGLLRLEGVDWVSEEADHATQTCAIRMKRKQLPDLDALARSVSELRLGASLRGVEAGVAGTLDDADGALVLHVSETGERLPLAPLRAKIQWSLETQRELPMTREEETALTRLREAFRRGTRRCEVVGPLVREGDGLLLEVRSFGPTPDDRW